MSKASGHDRDADVPLVPVGGGVPVDATGRRYGYLPRRAARRKIVIRAELGSPWVIAAASGAVLIAVVAAVFLGSRPTRPGPPFADVGPLAAYVTESVATTTDGSAWIDRRDGLRAWSTQTTDGAPVGFCPADGGWSTRGGTRYDRGGRLAGAAGPRMLRLPARAARNHVYVDTDHPAPVTGSAPQLDVCPRVTFPDKPG
ncbi:MAG: hypothetical protein ABR520_10355 [Mycobacteriales bacterium]|nr:hypothetical protein [Frankia sp.]